MNYNINIEMYKMLKYIIDGHIKSLYERFDDAMTFFEHGLLEQTNKNDETAITAVHDYIAQNLHYMIDESRNKMNKSIDKIFHIDVCNEITLKN